MRAATDRRVHAPLKLSPPSLLALRAVVLGEVRADGQDPVAPYRTHRQIGDFFDEANLPETARAGEGSRENRVAFALKHVNGAPGMLEVIRVALHPGHFASEDQLATALDFLNSKLRFDRLQLSVQSGDVVVGTIEGITIEAETAADDPLSDEHIQRLIQRAEHRLQTGEFDAAVTVARTLLEDALHEIERRLLGTREDFGGDLMKLYKHVGGALRLDEQRKDLDDNYRALIRGLTTVVGAIAPLSNSSSDRHSPRRLPAAHHARLCVNAAKTVVVFLRDSYLAQTAAGTLTPSNSRAPKAPRR